MPPILFAQFSLGGRRVTDTRENQLFELRIETFRQFGSDFVKIDRFARILAQVVKLDFGNLDELVVTGDQTGPRCQVLFVLPGKAFEIEAW